MNWSSRRLLTGLLVGWLTACGDSEPNEPQVAQAEPVVNRAGERAAEISDSSDVTVVPPSVSALPGDGMVGGGVDLPATSGSETTAEQASRLGQSTAALIGGGPSMPSREREAAEALATLAELGRPGLVLDEAQQARLKAAQDVIYGAAGSDRRLQNEDRLREQLGLQAVASQAKAAWEASQPQTWALKRHVARGAGADLTVRVGDIDNLGFGWPVGFDPFSGDSTPAHRFPWTTLIDEPAGTDRIMVISGYVGATSGETPKQDGYTRTTKRPRNAVRPIVLEYDLSGLTLKSAQLQMFVDDFQAPSFGNHYRVWLDGREAPLLAEALNALWQRGPVGKLVTFQILPEQFDLLADGRLEILIDDPHTNVGDGYAIDFVQLLINPGDHAQVAAIEGRVTDRVTREPIPGALVSSMAVREGRADAEGRYTLDGVPAGLAVVIASHPEYNAAAKSQDLKAGTVLNLDFELERRDESSQTMEMALSSGGCLDLYGIEFETDRADIRPDSAATLEQVLDLLQRRSGLALVIAGHTDDQGSESYNLDLSQRRSAAVVDWLAARGIAADRLRSEGFGETRPLASNATDEGRARNRRVELCVAR